MDEFLAQCKKKVYITAGGPYGNYGRVDEAGLFEAIAEASPTAKFKANTYGFTTGQNDDFIGEFKNGKLNLTYSFLPDDCENFDTDEVDEEWFTEKTTYDPVNKEYKRKYSEEDYIRAMVKNMPLAEFKNLFGLSKENISDSEYYDYIDECYCAYSFPDMGYIDLKSAFSNAEIEEEEFNNNLTIAIKKFGLVDFETFCK